MTPALPLLYAALTAVTDGANPEAHASLVWALVALTTLATWTWLGRRQRRLGMDLQELHSTLDAQRQALEQSRLDHAHALRGIKASLRETEQQLAAQKKKNYIQAQALTAADMDLREALAAANRKSASPARVQAAKSVSGPARVAAAAATPEAPADAVSPEPTPAPATQPNPVAIEPRPADDMGHGPSGLQAALDAEHSQKVEALDLALRQSEAARTEACAAAATALAQNRRLNKRIEDLRRVDLMSRGKVQVLEDKVARLGREHYEAISALALVRGEVALPKRRRQPARPDGPQAQPKPEQSTREPNKGLPDAQTQTSSSSPSPSNAQGQPRPKTPATAAAERPAPRERRPRLEAEAPAEAAHEPEANSPPAMAAAHLPTPTPHSAPRAQEPA